MAPRRPRDIGTHTESAAVRYLRTAGFPHAERRSLRGTLDAGDITGCIGTAWSVKGGMMACGASDARADGGSTNSTSNAATPTPRSASSSSNAAALARTTPAGGGPSCAASTTKTCARPASTPTGPASAQPTRCGCTSPPPAGFSSTPGTAPHPPRPNSSPKERQRITYYGTLRQSEADREDTIRTLICPACRAPRRTRCTRDGRTQGVSCTGRYDRAAERGLRPKWPVCREHPHRRRLARRAACRGYNPDWWSVPNDGNRQAKLICANCPMKCPLGERAERLGSQGVIIAGKKLRIQGDYKGTGRISRQCAHCRTTFWTANARQIDCRNSCRVAVHGRRRAAQKRMGGA